MPRPYNISTTLEAAMAHSRPKPLTDPTDRLVGDSPAIAALRADIRRLAPFDTVGTRHVPTLLLQGETGTGKGLVARVVHDSGARAQGPFIEVNCAAIPDTLFETELFGHEAGAFSDAKRAKPGLIEAAAWGTLFLDEIDTLPLSLQAKLLTALEEKRVRRVGAVTAHDVDVKLIAATQTELSGLVRAGRFRADLFYRLAVMMLTLPPLRERSEDILVLARAFLQRYAAAYGVPPKRLSQAAETWLRQYAWPGNVREVSHLMERLTLLHPADLVESDSLERLRLPPAEPPPQASPLPAAAESGLADEAARIRQALAETGGNAVQAARLLGLGRGALRHRMLLHGIKGGDGAEEAPRPMRRGAVPPRAQRREKVSLGLSQVEAAIGERKVVAVLAVDLTLPDSFDLAGAGSDPWTASRHWEQAVEEQVRGFGGLLLPRGGPPLLAVFGVPHALEQLPQRAVHAALAIRRLASEAQAAAGPGPGPAVRQAVHLGSLLVGGQAGPLQFMVASETLSITVRLLGQAAAGDLLVSSEVGRLVAGWCELTPYPRPGGEGPPGQVGAYCVGSLAPRHSSLAGMGARALSPFVGRERELATLQALLEQVEGGRGQAVEVVGEPGMGKSRLLYEFHRGLVGRRMTHLEGRCLAYGQHSPYLPVLDLLRDHCGIIENDAPALVAEKIHRALQEAGLAPDDRAPYLLHLLGLVVGTERLAGVSPDMIKLRTIDTLWQLSLHDSRRRPLILVIEDLQWVDPSSEVFFTTLVERLADLPILFLATYRPGYRPPWSGRSYVTELTLPPLLPQDSRRLLQAVCQGTPVPEPVAQVVLARAEGNPFFVEELGQVLGDQDASSQVKERGPQDPLAYARGGIGLRLPPTVQGVLAARIDRLSGQLKGLLHTLAVVGHACPIRLLEQVVEQPAEVLRQYLARLQAEQFLYEYSVDPEPEYAFKHALTHDVAYTSLPPERRRATHARVLAALEALYVDRLPELIERLAHHALRGEIWEKAMAYGRQAGAKAIARSAYQEAVAYFEQALDALQHFPQQHETVEHAIDLRFELRTALQALGMFERLHDHLRVADTLAQSLDDPGRQGWVAAYQSAYWFSTGAPDQAVEAGERALTLARACRDDALRVVATYFAGLAALARGNYRQAVTYLRQNIAASADAPPHEHFGLPGPAAVLSRGWLAWCLAELGMFAEGLAQGTEGVRLAETVAHPFALTSAVRGLCTVYLRQGNLQQAISVLERGLNVSQGWHLPLRTPIFGAALGYAYALAGRPSEALPLVEQAAAQMPSIKRLGYQARWLAYLSEAYLLAGRLAEAGALAGQALDLSRKHQERGHEAWALRLLGELHAQSNPLYAEGAEEAYRQALTLAEELGMRPLIAHCHLGLGALYAQTGGREQAHTELATAAELFRSMGMALWLPRVEVVRAQLEGW
jgi:DNA-binding NtrC family response regulator/tetratricopeptide (TPR) repeat protein